MDLAVEVFIREMRAHQVPDEIVETHESPPLHGLVGELGTLRIDTFNDGSSGRVTDPSPPGGWL